MRRFSAIIAAVALLPIVVLAAPSVELKSVIKLDGPTKPNSYIVKLKDDVSKSDHLAWLDANHNATSNVTYRDWQTKVFHGYAANFEADALNALCASPDVDYIEEDGIIKVGSTAATVVQTNAPWGLQRISQDPKITRQSPFALDYTFIHDSSAGDGVDVYIVDTGIYIDHNDFGGRAVWGATFGPYEDRDITGHGTMVAGIAGGTRFGVSKRARLIAVKVLEAGGFSSDLIAGIDFVVRVAAQTGNPSVVNISIEGPASAAVDSAVASLVASGVHSVVIAGNSDTDASTVSPAREPTAITVGAMNISDVRWESSNWGPAVDIFAPGENIVSLGIRTPDTLVSGSGTSLAAPHVAGIIGTFITTGGNLPPAAMATKLDSLSLKGVLADIPAGTTNKLARNEQ